LKIGDKKMALKVKAINLTRVKLKMQKPVRVNEMVKYIADRTSLNSGEIKNVIDELHDTVVHFCMQGRTVIFEGLGRYSPNISISGEIGIRHATDNKLQKAVNDLQVYKGEVVNRENIVNTADELIAIWNEQHPEDPVTD
jgi:nucleoid DNA-binding protein